MAAKYYLTLTNYGSTLIAQAHEQSLIQLQNFVIGDANNVPYDPITEIDRTTLVNQKASVPIQDIQIIDDFIRVTATFGTSVGGFNIHEIGITNETGQLVYIGNYHGGYKPILEDGAGGQLTILIDIKGTSANNISLIVDENINTATQAWVKENYIERSNIVDNLTTEDANKPVSAKQVKYLNDNKLGKTENAVSADKLKTIRTISFSGGATGSFNYDGSGNSSCILTLANSGVVASTYGSSLKIPTITVNAKGLITGVSERDIPIVDNLTTDDATKPVSAKQAKKLQDEKLAISNLVNDLTSGGYETTITAEAIKLFYQMFSGGPSRLKIPNPLEPDKPWIIQFFNTPFSNANVEKNFVQNFPVAFPNQCTFILASDYQDAFVNINIAGLALSTYGKTKTGVGIIWDAVQSGSYPTSRSASILAIGN